MNSAKKYFQIIVSFSFCAIVLLSSVTQTAYGANSTSNTTVTSKVDANGNVVRTTSIVIYTTKSIDQVKDTLVATSVINEHLLYDAMQAYRKEQKKKTTLKYSTKLSETAREYAKYLSDNKSFSHQDKQGNNGEVRLKKAGMSLSYWGELLAEATDAPQAFSALKGSVKHKEIMLKDDYTIV